MTPPENVPAMFGRIAPRYDLVNRLLSGGADIFWRAAMIRRMSAALVPGERALITDLASGTMDVALGLAKSLPSAAVIALDASLPMLRAGQHKISKKQAFYQLKVIPIQADALCLPLKDGSMDAVSCAFGLRNMERSSALAEMRRVLKTGKSLWILEFGSAGKKIWGGLYNFYLARLLPYLGGLVSGEREAYAYLAATIQAFPAPEELAEELRAAGFSRVSFRSFWGGIVFLHSAEK